MAFAELQVPSAALQQLGAAFREAVAITERPTPLLKQFGVVVLQEIAENFRVGGRPAWKPIAASTARARRGGQGGQPLVDTGRLRDSFDARVGTDEVVIFSRNPVAVFAEFGTVPHEIRARNAKALAIPGLTPTSTGRSLRGLGRARSTGRGSFRTTGGKTRVPFRTQDLTFRKAVHHPGTPPRPVLPTVEQVAPKLLTVVEQYVTAALIRQVAATGT